MRTISMTVGRSMQEADMMGWEWSLWAQWQCDGLVCSLFIDKPWILSFFGYIRWYAFTIFILPGLGSPFFHFFSF
jgi:hypothetical protein